MNKFSLVGKNGNAFCIINFVISAMRQVGFNPSDIQEYQKKATSGNYDMLLMLSIEMIDKCNEKLEIINAERNNE